MGRERLPETLTAFFWLDGLTVIPIHELVAKILLDLCRRAPYPRAVGADEDLCRSTQLLFWSGALRKRNPHVFFTRATAMNTMAEHAMVIIAMYSGMVAFLSSI
jgi:hypothetical protein